MLYYMNRDHNTMAFLLFPSKHLKLKTYLNESRMQVNIVRHDDSTDDSDRLEKLGRSTALTVREKQPLHYLFLVWSNHDVLKDQSSITL